MVTYGNRNSHLFQLSNGFICQTPPFIPPEVHTHRQFSLVIFTSVFRKRFQQKIQISFPCHIGWKFDRMPAHHRCIPIQSGKIHPIDPTYHFPPHIRVYRTIQTEARYGLRYKRAGHPLLIQRDPSSIVEIVQLVIIPMIPAVSDPHVGRQPIVYGIGIANAIFHLTNPLQTFILPVILIAMNRAPTIETFLCANADETTSPASCIPLVQPFGELNLKLIVP